MYAQYAYDSASLIALQGSDAQATIKNEAIQEAEIVDRLQQSTSGLRVL